MRHSKLWWVYVQGVCVWGYKSKRVSVQGVNVQGVSVQGGLCPGGKCPGGYMSRGKCPGGTCPDSLTRLLKLKLYKAV